MRRPLQALLGAVFAVTLLVSCAASRSAWVTLTPVGRSSETDVHQAEKKLRGIVVAAKLLQGKSRYSAQVEVHNLSAWKTAHGPENVFLQDASGLVQPEVSAEDLKEEIRRDAASEAAYSMDYWGGYYDRPRRVYYGHGRYRYVYPSPAYHNDWFERRLDAERILAHAESKIAAVDADYLRSQDIPPLGSVSGFIPFTKKPAKGAPAVPLKLSLTVEKRVFTFEFFDTRP